ncbi:hypothetical protein [Lacticaseibacillus thailandensis]|uniref:HEPN domain-containing protein n=1 Tax=Lacticaseibacillus thailandensis DSM 22698 = JCM 13996 TaxID=1423810 RepID=A0A0R2C9C4_9LACO|nr:hypothetical protein [Lacticaseibacillus thailandensis]KRM86596.1 hypothetical protein FD19_GL001785 [Lacticaseibacillus thailandensis DSM 22698 = JCM 13996]
MDDVEAQAQAERTAWLLERTQQQAQRAQRYPDQLFWRACANFVRQQDHALTMARGEVDGRTWDHEQW